VREVALVAQALEGARVDLKRSLTELRREKDWTEDLDSTPIAGPRHKVVQVSSALPSLSWRGTMPIARECGRLSPAICFTPCHCTGHLPSVLPPN
jgi:hypothetical protein